MKKIILSVIILLNLDITNLHSNEAKNNPSHKISYAQNVHMYICIEALKLLKDRYPQTNFSQIENRIGTMSDYGKRPWQVGTITCGSSREDEEDVVYDIRGPFHWYVSSSHFWNADRGDDSLTHLQLIGDYPNAYSKIRRYVSGQWNYWNNGDRNYINYLSNTGTTYRYTYHNRGFIGFYKTKKIILHSYVNILGQEFIRDEEITLDDFTYHKIVWEILGRMIHLLCDVTVPPHVHNDVHVRELDGGDCYHNYIDDGAYQQYNWQTAKTAGGLINPYEIGDDPIRYLMYTSDQLADHFPSGPDCLEIPQQHFGNNNLPGGSYPILDRYYLQLGPAPQNITNLYLEGSYCFNHAIRATAGLLYWFAVETGIITPDPGAFPVINSFSGNLPDNNIFRGETFKLTCNASGSNLNYNWFYKVCNINNFCQFPINGLAYSQNNKTYSITNNNFSNRWTCSYYDSVCNANINFSNSLLENPLNLYIGVTASNQFGSDTKYFNFNNLQSINPLNAVRPPPPPPPYYGGCPFLLVVENGQLKYENNILNESTFQKNKDKDIEDKIVIRNRPDIDTTDNTIFFAVKETDIDDNYFDKFSLIAIDHPSGNFISVTSSNDIVMINPKEVKSPLHAFKDGADVTFELGYDSAFDKGVKGKGKEIIELEYDTKNNFYSNGMKDSFAIILDPAQTDEVPLSYKDAAGFISIEDSSGINISNDIEFSKRQIREMVTVPVSFEGNILKARLTCKHDFDLSYAALADVMYVGFTEHKLSLIYAENFLTGDILKTLTYADGIYSETDSSSFIILKFKNTGEKIPDGWVRDYVMVINGKTIAPDQSYRQENSNDFISNETKNKIFDKYVLEQNFPNPFNPLTVIQYSLSEEHFTTLKIYDVTGKEVKTLVSKEQSPGSYSVTFDGSNYPSGIYYYKITSGDFVQVRKMVLLR